MPKCPTCLIDNQHTDCKRRQCNTCCTAHPYIYGACPFHDASRPPSTIPTGAQLPDKFTAAHRRRLLPSLNPPLPPLGSLPAPGVMDDSKNNESGSTTPLTFEMIQTLFAS